MSDPDAGADRPDPPLRSRRSANTVAPEPQRVRSQPSPASERADVGEPAGPSQRPGDVPPSLTRRYFTETLRGGATLAYYEGPGAKRVAFHDHGERLATDQTHPALIRDLALIAAHRGWSTVRVTGEDAFRREMWMEARALGLDVKGYRPKERDQQELDRRLEAVKAATERARPGPSDRKGSQPSPPRGKPDYDMGVAGVLLDFGEAPYHRRTGARATPFVRLDRGDGRILDIWGAGLPDALARSGARRGDAIHVRRDGVDVVARTRDPRVTSEGMRRPGDGEGRRHRWIIEAERFRRATPAQAARDKAMHGAQSHLRILDSVIDMAIANPGRRARLHAEARELVAAELAQGRRFTPARIREVEPVMARDLAEARSRDNRSDLSRQR